MRESKRSSAHLIPRPARTIKAWLAQPPDLRERLTAPGTYSPRGTSSLQRLFRVHLPELLGRYNAEFAARLGKYRQERITRAVERFLECGDYSKGFAVTD